MPTMIAIEDNQLSLPELLERLEPGEEMILTRNHQPIAKLISEIGPRRPQRQAGNCKGLIQLLAEDDDHLAGFPCITKTHLTE